MWGELVSRGTCFLITSGMSPENLVLRERKFAILLLVFGVVMLIVGNRRSTVRPYAEYFAEGAGQAAGERP